MEKETFSLWLAVDNEGNSAVSMDGAAEARAAIEEDWPDAEAIRVTRVNVAMALPLVGEVDVDVAEEDGDEAEAEVGEETEHLPALHPHREHSELPA